MVIDDELSYNVAALASKFNKKKFFDKEFYSISLFYLGMTTLKDKFVTTLPNWNRKHIKQVKKYGEDTKRKFPNHQVRIYIVYICTNKGWKCWEV